MTSDETAAGAGDLDLRFTFTGQDAAAAGELLNARLQIAGALLTWHGLPLLPSVAVLAAVGLYWVAAAFAGLFLLFVLYCLWQAQPDNSNIDDLVEVMIRDGYVHVRTKEGEVRRHWAWFDAVTLRPSWICLERRGTNQLTIPRRVLDGYGPPSPSGSGSDRDAERLAADWQRRIDAARLAQPAAVEPFDCDDLVRSHEFTYTRGQLEDLLRGKMDLLGPESPQSKAPGCRSGMLTLMMCSAVMIGVLPYSSSRRVVIWCAVCAAMWLPWLVWRLMAPLRVRDALGEVEETLLQDVRTHAIAARGLVDRSRLAQELFTWDEMAEVQEGRAFVFFQTRSLYLATPVAALEDPGAFVRTAKELLQQSRASEETYLDQAPDPGPAVESGNPYQPPRPPNS